MSNGAVCPICGLGTLSQRAENESFSYKGQTIVYKCFYSIRDVCQVEQSGPNELKTNKRSIIKAKKIIDGLLTGDELRQLRLSLNLTQSQAAKVFGGGPIAFTKYEADDVCQSESMDKLIRYAHKYRPVFEDLCTGAGIKVSIYLS